MVSVLITLLMLLCFVWVLGAALCFKIYWDLLFYTQTLTWKIDLIEENNPNKTELSFLLVMDVWFFVIPCYALVKSQYCDIAMATNLVLALNNNCVATVNIYCFDC